MAPHQQPGEPDELNSLSKSAFDTSKSVIEGMPDSVEKGWNGRVKDYMVDKGYVKETDYDDFSSHATSIWDKISSGDVVGGAAKAASAGAGYFVGGPWGAAMGTIIEVAAQAFGESQDKTKIGKANATFRAGEWVQIDNGQVFGTEPGKTLRRRTWGMDIPGWDEEEPGLEKTVLKQHDISIGFYIGDGVEANMHHVFNFKRMEVQDVYVFDVAPLSIDETQRLDKTASNDIRDLFFQTRDTTTGGNVNTDPGAEVIFDNARFNIVRSVGDQAVIEDVWGNQKQVNIGELTRGRVTNTSSHKYTREGAVSKDNFQTLGKDELYSGQWVWVDSRKETKRGTRELLCVSYIAGKSVVGFYALDGKKGFILEDQVRLVSDDYFESLNAMANFQVFRSLAVKGNDTISLFSKSLGSQYPLMCIGDVDGPVEKRRIKVNPATDSGAKPVKDLGMVGDGGLKDAVDEAYESGKKTTGIPAAEEYDKIYDTDEAPTNTSNGLIPILVIVGGAILIFNSIQV